MYQSEDLYTEDAFDNDNQEVNYPDDGGNDNDGEEDKEGDEDETETSRQVVKVKRVLKPRYNLNAALLTGPKGLSAIKGYFKNIKYKGKGREEEDLNVIMKIYEHWCHRLYPKYPFDDCLKKIEMLGAKRTVMTHIKKIRMNLEEMDDEQTKNDEEVMEDDNSENETADIPSEEHRKSNELTEEQQEQIRINRERAQAIRMQRLKEVQDKAFNKLNSQEGSSTVCEENEDSSPFNQEQIELNETNMERAENLIENSQNKSQTNDVNVNSDGDDNLFSQVSSNIDTEMLNQLDNSKEIDAEDSPVREERLQMDDLLDEMETRIDSSELNCLQDEVNETDDQKL